VTQVSDVTVVMASFRSEHEISLDPFIEKFISQVVLWVFFFGWHDIVNC